MTKKNCVETILPSYHKVWLAFIKVYKQRWKSCLLCWNSYQPITCIQLFWERSEKTVHATIPKGNMGYDQRTFPDTVAVESTFVAFLSTRKHTSMASSAILWNFFEKQWTQNHPRYLLGLSRALFPTFLEIAVCSGVIWAPSPRWLQTQVMYIPH